MKINVFIPAAIAAIILTFLLTKTVTWHSPLFWPLDILFGLCISVLSYQLMSRRSV